MLFSCLLAVSKPFYIAMLGVALPGMLIYITPTYWKFLYNYDTNKLTEKTRRKKLEDTISSFIMLSFALFLIYCLFNYKNLRFNVAMYIFYGVIIITSIAILYLLIFSLLEFCRMIMGKPVGTGAVHNGSIIIYSTSYLILLLQSAKYKTLLLYIEKAINSLVNVFIKDWVIILIYFSVFSFLALALFVNFINSLKILLKYISLKSHSKRNKNIEEIIKKSLLKNISCKIYNEFDKLWSVIENETNSAKAHLLRGIYSIFYVITLLFKAIYAVISFLFQPIINAFNCFIKFIKTLLSRIQESDTATIVALSSRVTIVVTFCVNYVFFKYNNIISNNGVDVFEFLFTIFIIPSILASIVKFQQKQKENF